MELGIHRLRKGLSRISVAETQRSAVGTGLVDLPRGRQFMTGNEVIAWAAIAAGADIMYGYPITPQNEIMHYWTRLAPKFGRGFLQTEDEMSAGFATIGGVLAGKRAFTATAGPGNVLMQDPLAMAEMMRLPVVVIICQRGGPSTATVIYSQQEVNLTCFGGNGEGLRIVYSPSSHHELYTYVLKAFNTAWTYHFPTFVLGDGYQSKMREPVELFDPADRDLEPLATVPYLGGPGVPGVDREPVLLRNTYNLEEELFAVLSQHQADYQRMAEEVAEYEQLGAEEAEVIVIAHGAVARAARAAVEELWARGVPVGLFRPITLRPFPAQALRLAVAQDGTSKVKRLLVCESAQGQLERLVKEALYGLASPPEMASYLRPGLAITPEEIMDQLKLT